MSHLVVFDTNVFVSYLFPSRKVTAVKLAVNKLFSGQAIPVFSDAIINEYKGVLNRAKFNFPAEKVRALIDLVVKDGRCIAPASTLTVFTDKSDKPFYDAAGRGGGVAGYRQQKALPRGALHCDRATVAGARGALVGALTGARGRDIMERHTGGETWRRY